VIEILALAWAVLAGIDPRRLIALALGLYAPLVVIGLAVWAVIKGRTGDDARPALFCEAVATELRSGADLAGALHGAAGAVGIRSVGTATTVEELVDVVGRELPQIEPELSAVATAGLALGGRLADLFDEIGAVAIAQSEIAREVRVATAPAKATALVFAGAPVAYLMFRMRNDGMSDLLGASGQRIAGTAGLLLFVLGAAVVGATLWRAT
jgi:hypothetical protein